MNISETGSRKTENENRVNPESRIQNPESLRGFWSLFVTQFQGAFSDNALKRLVIFLIIGMNISEGQSATR